VELRHGMYVLVLNDMRSSNIEHLTPVACAESYAELEALLSRERVEPYSDGRWGKSFRAGGPLEWRNPPPNAFGEPPIVQFNPAPILVPHVSELA
jgi:hypothetical protein